MNLSTSKTILKIAGIISIIFGVLGIIGGIMAIAGGSFLGIGLAIGEVQASQDIAAGVGLLGLGGLLILIGAVIELLSGIFSVRAAKDISKIMPAWVFSLIGLILSVPGLIAAISANDKIVSNIITVAINALICVAANTDKKSAGK